MTNKMIEESGEKLTEEIKEGIEDSKKEGGFKYFKSPTEMFSALDEMDKELKEVETYCETAKQESYSRVQSFSDLVKQIKLIVAEHTKEFSEKYQTRINEWILKYDENPTSDGFANSLKELRLALTDGDWLNSIPYERLHNSISQALSDYEKSTGELFFFSSVPLEVKEGTAPSLADKELESRDSMIFYLADAGFTKDSEVSYFKDIHGNHIDVDIGPNDAKILVSGNSPMDVTVPFDKVGPTIQRLLATTEAYSKRSAPAENSEVTSYSRSYQNNPAPKKTQSESYSQMLKRMIGL